MSTNSLFAKREGGVYTRKKVEGTFSSNSMSRLLNGLRLVHPRSFDSFLFFYYFRELSSTAVPLRLVGTSLAKHVINPPREGGCISFPSFLSIKISAVVERKVVEIELLSIEQRRWSIFSKIKVECRVETRWAMIIRREYKNERGQRRRRINIYSKYT